VCANGKLSPKISDLVDVMGALRSSLGAVIATELDLIELGSGERSLVHQLAIRLRRRVPLEFDVDVEYDREARDRALKRLPPPRHGMPDIVVHHRGQSGSGSNLLVVEVTRTFHGRFGSERDVLKVRAAMERFGYR